MENIASRVRRCSFCRCPFHNILSCDHSLLIEFQNNLFQKKHEILEMRETNLYEKMALFESWILYQCMFGNTFILKAYSVRYLGCTMRDGLNIYFQKITAFIWDYELDPENQLNPASIEVPEDVGLEWYIDRTGDQNLLPSSNINNNNITILIEESPLHLDLHKKEDCSICYENMKKVKMVQINCLHEFCGTCVKKIIHSNIKKCAFCRQPIESVKVKNKEMESFFKSI